MVCLLLCSFIIHGFAAEIEVHADVLGEFGIPNFFDSHTNRADLEIDGTHWAEYLFGLYNEFGEYGYIQHHIEFHGERPL